MAPGASLRDSLKGRADAHPRPLCLPHCASLPVNPQLTLDYYIFTERLGHVIHHTAYLSAGLTDYMDVEVNLH